MMHRLRSRAADDETARDAAASSAAVDERLQKQERELKERMNRKLEKQKLEHQRLVEGIREEQLDTDSKRNKTVRKVEGFLTNLQKHMSDELMKVSLTLKDTGGSNGMRQSRYDLFIKEIMIFLKFKLMYIPGRAVLGLMPSIMQANNCAIIIKKLNSEYLKLLTAFKLII